MAMTHIETAATVLPCPFCGAPPRTIDDDSYGACWIFCVCEHEPGIPRPVGELADAVAAWNKRAVAAWNKRAAPARLTPEEYVKAGIDAAANFLATIDHCQEALRRAPPAWPEHYCLDPAAIARAAEEAKND